MAGQGNKGNSRCSASTASGDAVVVADLDPKPLSPRQQPDMRGVPQGRKQKSGDD